MTHRVVLVATLTCSVLLGACAQTPPPAPAPDPAAEAAAIGKVREAFMAAYNAGDAEAIGKLYTEDAVSQPNHQPNLIGRAAIVASLKGMFERVTVKTQFTSEETRISGNAALDRGTYKAEVAPKDGGVPSVVEGRYVVAYVKGADGTWHAAHDIDNAVDDTPAPPPAAGTAAAPAPAPETPAK
jgi:uncharacterized protein (TIGR02246 family)